MTKMVFIFMILYCMFSLPLQACQDNEIFGAMLFVAGLLGYNHYDHLKKSSQLRADDYKPQVQNSAKYDENNKVELQLKKKDLLDANSISSSIGSQQCLRVDSLFDSSLSLKNPSDVHVCHDDSDMISSSLEESYCMVAKNKE